MRKLVYSFASVVCFKLQIIGMFKKTFQTAIILLAIISSMQAVYAQESKLKIGVQLQTIAVSANQKKQYEYDNPTNSSGAIANNSYIFNNSNININFDGKHPDFKYGLFIKLNADTSDNMNQESGNADKNMIYMQNNKIGRLEVGNYTGAGAALEMDVDNFQIGSYGHDGYWSSIIAKKTSKSYAYFDATSLSIVQNPLPKSNLISFIRTPSIPSNYLATHYTDAPKATFYTQPFSGLTFGVSYIPDLDSAGTISTVANKNSGSTDPDRMILGQNHPATYKGIFSGGIRYEFPIHNLQIKTTAVGEIGKAKNNKINDLKAWEAGMQITWDKFGIASSYGDWDRTISLKEKLPGTKQGGHYWTLNTLYHYSPKVSYSASYMQSKRAGGMEIMGEYINGIGTSVGFPLSQAQIRNYSDEKFNTLKNVIFDVDYKVSDGFVPFASVARFSFKEAHRMKGNKGIISMIGTKISF